MTNALYFVHYFNTHADTQCQRGQHVNMLVGNPPGTTTRLPVERDGWGWWCNDDIVRARVNSHTKPHLLVTRGVRCVAVSPNLVSGCV